jgi:predicted dienelactone hydrolase
MLRLTQVVALLVLATAPNWVRADGRSDPGSHKVQVVEGEWKDTSRDNRQVLWKCYLPADTEKPVPVVIYSHGGGGTRDTNAMLGRHLASHGFASLHVQHVGSDDRALRANPLSLKAVNDPEASEPRFRDIAFVVKQLWSGEQLAELKGRIDGERIGIAGHSYGGLTCQVVAGQQIKGYDQKLSVPELKGAFILSPSPPRGAYGDAKTSFQKMLMPMFSLTGTADNPPDKAFPATDRRIPFDRTSNVDQWLLVLDGASHFTLSGQEKRPAVASKLPGMEADPNLVENHAYIRAAAVAFWQMVFANDGTAKKYLNDGEFAKFVGKRGKVEHRVASK